MALSARQRETKELAIAILEANGKGYDDELDRFHQEIIRENQAVILKGLKNLKQRKEEKYEKK